MGVQKRHIQVKFFPCHYDQRVAFIIAHDDLGFAAVFLIAVRVMYIYPRKLAEGGGCCAAGSIFHDEFNGIILAGRSRRPRKGKGLVAAGAGCQFVHGFHAGRFGHHCGSIHRACGDDDIFRRHGPFVMQVKGNRKVLVHAIGTAGLRHVSDLQIRLLACHAAHIDIVFLHLFIFLAVGILISQLDGHRIIPRRHIRTGHQREGKAHFAAYGQSGKALAVEAAGQADAIRCQIIQGKLHLINVKVPFIDQFPAELGAAAGRKGVGRQFHAVQLKFRLSVVALYP